MAAAQRTRLGRRGEAGQDPVAGRLDEDAVVAGQQALDVDVELVEHAAPLAVAHLGGPHGRVHDVGEEHGGEQPCGGVHAALPGDELLHLVDDGVELAGPGQHVGPAVRDEAGPADVLGRGSGRARSGWAKLSSARRPGSGR